MKIAHVYFRDYTLQPGPAGPIGKSVRGLWGKGSQAPRSAELFEIELRGDYVWASNGNDEALYPREYISRIVLLKEPEPEAQPIKRKRGRPRKKA